MTVSTKSTVACAAAAGLLFLSGCSSTPPSTAGAPTPSVQAAEKVFEAGKYEEAIRACIEIARQDPLTPGLSDLQARINARLALLREESFARRAPASDAKGIMDGRRHDLLPETYGLSRQVLGETSPLRTPPTKMQEVLRRPVSVHLENVGLTDIIAQIGASQNVNIVADGSVGSGTLTIHAENTPLIEILDYIGRNLNVCFNAGDNIIWVTKRQDVGESGIPFQTRVYHLRKGLTGDELPDKGGSAASSPFGGNSGNGGSPRRSAPARNGGAGGKGGGKATPDIIDAVMRFVPQPTGADILFNAKSHVLLVKNTRENLQMTEDLIAVLDVRPLQVLIEARFMTLSVSDLRELGVDWVLNSPIRVTTKDGRTSSTIAPPGGITTANGDPNLAAQGLNLTYQGVLTSPQFSAVLHAMDQSGKGRTLTVPRVTTLNNSTATIRIGDDFRYFDEFTQQSITRTLDNGDRIVTYTDTQLVPSGSPKLEELGYELVVTPSVGADLSTISLKLVPQISSVKPESEWVTYNLGTGNNSGTTGDTTNGNNNATVRLPIFSRSLIETELIVHSGETVVMGGLAHTVHAKNRTGIPFLSSLPWIGALFRSDVDKDSVDNTIIFVTATILSDNGEELVPINPVELPGLPVKTAEK